MLKDCNTLFQPLERLSSRRLMMITLPFSFFRAASCIDFFSYFKSLLSSLAATFHDASFWAHMSKCAFRTIYFDIFAELPPVVYFRNAKGIKAIDY